MSERDIVARSTPSLGVCDTTFRRRDSLQFPPILRKPECCNGSDWHATEESYLSTSESCSFGSLKGAKIVVANPGLDWPKRIFDAVVLFLKWRRKSLKMIALRKQFRTVRVATNCTLLYVVGKKKENQLYVIQSGSCIFNVMGSKLSTKRFVYFQTEIIPRKIKCHNFRFTSRQSWKFPV